MRETCPGKGGKRVVGVRATIPAIVAAGLLSAGCTPPSISLPLPEPPPLPGPARVVDAAVAAVGLEIIALSEVRLGCDLNRVREATRPVDPAALGACPEELESETLEQLINQSLILEDAARFNIEVPPEAVARGIAQLEAQLAGPDGLSRLLARHDLDRAALEARIAREVLLGRYLERRIGLLVVVTPDEIERYYQTNRSQFGAAPLAQVEGQIRSYLSRLKYRDALAEYIGSLRARADIRRLGPSRGAAR
jgi:hypothetical protein